MTETKQELTRFPLPEHAALIAKASELGLPKSTLIRHAVAVVCGSLAEFEATEAQRAVAKRGVVKKMQAAAAEKRAASRDEPEVSGND